jgi:hypothetical protein
VISRWARRCCSAGAGEAGGIRMLESHCAHRRLRYIGRTATCRKRWVVRYRAHRIVPGQRHGGCALHGRPGYLTPLGQACMTWGCHCYPGWPLAARSWLRRRAA